jgi:hypothetical protein
MKEAVYMISGEDNDRREKRVEHHFVIRIRLVRPSGRVVWDVSTIRNMSKTGMLFYSSNHYNLNDDLEMRVKNPVIPEEIECTVKVMRCEPLKDMRDIYSVAVEIVDMNPNNREAYDSTIKLFLERSER